MGEKTSGEAVVKALSVWLLSSLVSEESVSVTQP
jgi:hypothetical protein